MVFLIFLWKVLWYSRTCQSRECYIPLPLALLHLCLRTVLQLIIKRNIHCNLTMEGHFKKRMSWQCLSYTVTVNFRDVVYNESLFFLYPIPESNLCKPEFENIWRDPSGFKLNSSGDVFPVAWATSSITQCIEVSKPFRACSFRLTLATPHHCYVENDTP